jgi:hypothetical protein
MEGFYRGKNKEDLLLLTVDKEAKRNAGNWKEPSSQTIKESNI